MQRICNSAHMQLEVSNSIAEPPPARALCCPATLACPGSLQHTLLELNVRACLETTANTECAAHVYQESGGPLSWLPGRMKEIDTLIIHTLIILAAHPAEWPQHLIVSPTSRTIEAMTTLWHPSTSSCIRPKLTLRRR